jgi:hypothetical protein
MMAAAVRGSWAWVAAPGRANAMARSERHRAFIVEIYADAMRKFRGSFGRGLREEDV